MRVVDIKSDESILSGYPNERPRAISAMSLAVLASEAGIDLDYLHSRAAVGSMAIVPCQTSK